MFVEPVSHQFEVAGPKCRNSHAAGDLEDDLGTRARLALQQHFGHVEAIQRSFLLEVTAGKVDERGKEISDVHHGVERTARAKFSRPAHQARHAHPTLIGRVFSATKRSVALFGQSAVVVGADQECVLRQAMLLQRRHDPADGFVETLERRFAS